MQTVETEVEIPLALELDLNMAEKMSPNEARLGVDFYYRLQKNRIQAGNRVRALQEEGVPANLPAWVMTNFLGMEKRVLTALARWAGAHPLGRWAQMVRGIGPVLSAGLLAHCDFNRARTPAALFRFAGLDPTLTWLGKEGAREAVKEAGDVCGRDTYAKVAYIAHKHFRRYSLLVEALTGKRYDMFDPAWTQKAVAAFPSLQGAVESHPLHLDNAIRSWAGGDTSKAGNVLSALWPELEWNGAAMLKYLARKPWNGALKVLAWKIGHSFVMVSGSKESVYGQLYRRRKAWEVEQNEAGRNAEAASASLEEKDWRNDNETRRAYEAGKLPAGRLDLRATRYATKVFLFHWWAAGDLLRRGRGSRPVRPWAIEHGGHVDYIEPEIPLERIFDC